LDLASILDSLAGAVADRVVEKLSGPKAPERIPLARVAEHGAPSTRWVTAKAREGAIALHGPRGGRFVWASELAALLASTTIRRRGRPRVHDGGGDVVADARAAVAELAARRVAK
jgi:hypothetical protein